LKDVVFHLSIFPFFYFLYHFFVQIYLSVTSNVFLFMNKWRILDNIWSFTKIIISVEKTWIGTRWHWFCGFQYSDDPVNLYFNIAYISQIPLPFLYLTYSHFFVYWILFSYHKVYLTFVPNYIKTNTDNLKIEYNKKPNIYSSDGTFHGRFLL
jgi:hypothetical protein